MYSTYFFVLLISPFLDAAIINPQNQKPQTYHSPKSEFHHVPVRQNPTINDVQNTFICLDKTCVHIEAFRISENYTMDCYNDELEIVFEAHSEQVYGFLSHKNQMGNIVSARNSKRSPFCRTIRKYL